MMQRNAAPQGQKKPIWRWSCWAFLFFSFFFFYLFFSSFYSKTKSTGKKREMNGRFELEIKLCYKSGFCFSLRKPTLIDPDFLQHLLVNVVDAILIFFFFFLSLLNLTSLVCALISEASCASFDRGYIL
ncbi:hypothetical protein Dimus_011634 [Dionaea muscipula]